MRPVTGRTRPRRVVVVGASLAGMFAAAASAGGGRSVTVLERDTLPQGPRPRDGVPQGRHAHVYLQRGLEALEALLPGFGAELRAAGAVPFDTGALAWLGELGWAPPAHQFDVVSATRPLFEHLVLQRVRAIPGVTVRDGVRVVALRRSAGGGPAWTVDLADGGSVPADLVVDASGRASRLPAWLVGVGVGPAAVSEVDARIGYSTRVLRLDARRVGPAGVVLLQTPETRRGGLALPVEDGRWLVGLVGSGESRPPRDAAGFTSFLESLADPALAELVQAGELEGDVAVHRRTANRRHHYEDVRDWPDGLLVLGDALCAFNPVYGQGITVAACEALLLRQALRRGLRTGDSRRLLQSFARTAALPWAIATGEDLRYVPGAGVPRAQSLMSRWTRELGRLSAHGCRPAHTTLARVYHLKASPWTLLRPDLVGSALRARFRGYGPATPRPQILDGGRAVPTPSPPGA